MIIALKDGLKLIGITVMMACAVFVCSLFLNYQMDLKAIAQFVQGTPMQALYDAQIMTGKMITGVSGACLVSTSLLMLCFYIKHYIDDHKQELGILKALGYPNWQIAQGFWVFGGSVFVGSILGYSISWLMMPLFYATQNKDAILPEVTMHFHILLPLVLILLPTMLFAGSAIWYAQRKLTQPVMYLLKQAAPSRGQYKKIKPSVKKETSFITILRKQTLHSKKSLSFFILFASFCFSSMMQMTFSMGEIASEVFVMMMFVIGVILSCSIMFLSLSTVLYGNRKTIAMMRVFGYAFEDCKRAVLSGYRNYAYLGFVLGTIYQYALLTIMIDIVFQEVDIGLSYAFNWSACFLVLVTFILLYEVLMKYYTAQLKNISIKEVMLET